MGLNGRVPAGTSTENKGKRFSVSLEAVTLRQALHKMAKDSGVRFWIFRSYGDGSFSIGNSTR
jgi:hypothetical protein